MAKLTLVDIRRATIWEDIRPKLETLADDQGCEWRPEDVYAFCATNKAWLYLAEEDGFVVMQKLECPFRGTTTLFVWIAYGVGLHADYLPELERIARQEGANLIEFKSKRPFERLGGAWEKSYTIYQRGV